MLERGFEYFSFPEGSDDSEIIAHQYVYCALAVEKWPEFRRELEEAGAKSPRQCDDIERNAIDVFREVRDAIMTALDMDNPAVMSEPRLLDRLAHAHAFMALHADPTSLLGYRRMICPQIDSLPSSGRPEVGDFSTAVWEGKWNALCDQTPAEVTYRETLHNSWLHEHDGLFNSGRRLDPVAMASQLSSLFPATEPVQPLSTMQLAFIREKLRAIGRRGGLPKGQADFLVRVALDGAKQKDNPTAWRAIRDRKRAPLLAKVRELLATLAQPQN